MNKELEEAFYILKDTASGLQAYLPSEISNACNIVKSALTDKQDLEKFARLVIEKKVDIKLVMWAGNMLEAYNQKVRDQKDYWWRDELTQDEFDFAKEMIAIYG